MFILEETRAQKLLKKAHKVNRRGKRKVATYLFAIARRAMKDAKEYDLLDTEIGPQIQNNGQDMTEELESLYWKGIYLYQRYGEFTDFCQKHRL